MSLFVNGMTVAKMTYRAPWSGVWTADLDLLGELLPSGKVAIVSDEGFSLLGTVDDDRSGTFGERRSIKVVGGGNGWHKPVRAQHYHSDVAVNLAQIVSTTAAEVGEVGVTLIPTFVGQDFVRYAAPASQIFQGLGFDWWVTVAGVTTVGIRPPLPPHPSLLVKEWDPTQGVATFTCEVLPEPGMVLVDPRFGATTKTVREVEAIVSEGSVTGTLWLVDSRPDQGALNEVAEHVGAIAVQATRIAAARYYEYRVIAMVGDRAELVATDRAAGAPDLLPCSVWAGISGYKATLRPLSKVLVGFRGGDPRKPFIAFYEPPEEDGWRPLILELDALASVKIGGETAEPAVPASAFLAWAAAVEAALVAATSPVTPTSSIAVPAIAAALQTKKVRLA